MSVAHDQVNQHILDIQLDSPGFEVVQPHLLGIGWRLPFVHFSRVTVTVTVGLHDAFVM